MRFPTLLENTSDAVALLGADGRVLHVSPAFTAMLGHHPAELMGKVGFEVIHPRDWMRVRRLFARSIWEGAVPQHAEVRCRHTDRSWRELELSLVSRLDDPSVDAIVVTIRDITSRK